MNPKTKELWVIPTIIALATGIPLGAGFMFLSLWLAGTPINASFSLEWIKVALSTSLPMWVTLAVLTVATIITGLFFRQRAKTAEEKAQWVSNLDSRAQNLEFRLLISASDKLCIFQSCSLSYQLSLFSYCRNRVGLRSTASAIGLQVRAKQHRHPPSLDLPCF
jgi:hypothetical protein